MRKTASACLHGLLGAAILSGFCLSAARAQIGESQAAALVEALRLAAPKEDKRAEGLYSDWQIRQDNISRWSKRCAGETLTPTEFSLSPTTARAILMCVMGDVLREQYQLSGGNELAAVRRATAWWMTGDPEQHNSASIDAYMQRVLGYYQQQQPGQQPVASTNTATTSLPPLQLQTSLRPTAQADQSGTAAPEAQAVALVEALRLAAPQTGRSNDDLYSDWQIKPDNIRRWSQRCLGRELTPTQFEADYETARRVLICVMGSVLGEQYRASGNDELTAVRRAAAWWMTGDPQQYDDGFVRAYTQEVLDYYIIRRKIDAG